MNLKIGENLFLYLAFIEREDKASLVVDRKEKK